MPKQLPFTDQIRKAVEDCEMTRYQISQETGIDQASLSRFVHGELGLSVAAIDTLADLLGLEVTTKKDQ